MWSLGISFGSGLGKIARSQKSDTALDSKSAKYYID
jgi:hypothetical protein